MTRNHIFIESKHIGDAKESGQNVGEISRKTLNALLATSTVCTTALVGVSGYAIYSGLTSDDSQLKLVGYSVGACGAAISLLLFRRIYSLRTNNQSTEARQ